MLTYNEILYSFTKKLSVMYKDVDIYTTETLQGFENSCFFVQILPIFSKVVAKSLDEKALMVEISYFLNKNDDISIAYDKLSELQQTFSRGITVKDRFLKFSTVEHEILKDDIGYRLSFKITINYNEEIYIEEQEYSLIGGIEIAINNGTRKSFENEQGIVLVSDEGQEIILNLED